MEQIFKKILIYLFIWLHWVLVVAYAIFSCGLQDFLAAAWELLVEAVGSGSLTKDRTWLPALGARSVATQPSGKSLMEQILNGSWVKVGLSKQRIGKDR